MPIRRPIGVLGHAERAAVDERGRVTGPDESWSLDWQVVDATGRWRDPAIDPTVRQVALGDAPVFETAMRVGGGDVRHRAFCGVDDRPVVVVEVENDSPEPVAFVWAMSVGGPAVEATRVPSSPPPDAPAPLLGGCALPVAHRAVVRLAVPLVPGLARERATLPSAAQVAAGWQRLLERGERVEGPGTLSAELALARAEVLLDEATEPAAFLIAAGARWRLNRESIDVGAAEVARVAQLLVDRARIELTVVDEVALVEAKHLLAALDEPRASGDVDAALDRLPAPVSSIAPTDGCSRLADIRTRLVAAASGGPGLVLLPRVPDEWRGADIAAHALPTRWGDLSFAVRWHGPRPALLWECDAEVRLRAPGLDATWQTEQPSGEALLSGVSEA